LYKLLLDTEEKITQNFLSGKKKEIGIISIVLIIIFTFGMFFYQQNITEENIKQGIFNKFRDNQMDSTHIMAEHISSDLEVACQFFRSSRFSHFRMVKPMMIGLKNLLKINI
jgi:hypothetical protein